MKLIEILQKMKVSDLKKEISKQNIKGYSKLKKAEIIKIMTDRPDKFKYLLLDNMKQKKELLQDKIKLKEAKDKLKKLTAKKKPAKKAQQAEVIKPKPKREPMIPKIIKTKTGIITVKPKEEPKKYRYPFDISSKEVQDNKMEIEDLSEKNKELLSNVYIARIGYRGEKFVRDMNYLSYLNLRLGHSGGYTPKEAIQSSSHFLSQIKDLLKQLKNVKVGGGKDNDKEFKIGELKVLVPIESKKEPKAKPAPKKEEPMIPKIIKTKTGIITVKPKEKPKAKPAPKKKTTKEEKLEFKINFEKFIKKPTQELNKILEKNIVYLEQISKKDKNRWLKAMDRLFLEKPAPKKEAPKPKPEPKKEAKELSKDEKELQQLFINDARLKNKFKATKSPMISGLSPKERDIRSKIRIDIDKEIKENKFLLFELEGKMKLKKEADDIKKEKTKLKLFKLNVKNFLKKPTEALLEFIDVNIELMDELPEREQDKLDKAITKFEKSKK